jgi:hypothetical protein
LGNQWQEEGKGEGDGSTDMIKYIICMHESGYLLRLFKKGEGEIRRVIEEMNMIKIHDRRV